MAHASASLRRPQSIPAYRRRLRNCRLTPPSRAIFILSVLLAVLALLVRYAHVSIPIVSTHSFETLLIGFLLLLAGNLFRGF